MFGFVRREEYRALEVRVEALETSLKELREALGCAEVKAGPELEKERRERELAVQWENFWAYDGRPQKGDLQG